MPPISSPGGRLGLVLPAELLSVNYAADVRRFLLCRFGQVRLVTFEQLVFPDALEDVVLLLAQGRGPTDHFELYQAGSAADLADDGNHVWTTSLPGEKWTSALLDRSVLDVYGQLTSGEGFLSKYHRLAAALRRDIDAGLYRPGDQLPSESQLVERFGVSQPTV
ncbi:MAG: GntR family transcriptional regulator, partial [Egibacteraceae bacterium]